MVPRRYRGSQAELVNTRGVVIVTFDGDVRRVGGIKWRSWYGVGVLEACAWPWVQSVLRPTRLQEASLHLQFPNGVQVYVY